MPLRSISLIAGFIAVPFVFALGLTPAAAAAQPGSYSPGAGPEMPSDTQALLAKLQADLKTAERKRNPKDQARALNGIGDLYTVASAYPQAENEYDQALTLARSGNDAQQQAAALNGMANCYRALSQNVKALATFQQALDIATASRDVLGQATALNGIGWVNAVSTGQTQKALELHRKALLLAQQAGDRKLEASVLRRIGVVYDLQGDRQTALEFLERALSISRAVSDRSGEAATLSNMGKTHSNMGEKQKALELYNQALPLERAVGDRATEAKTLMDIGIAYSDIGEKQKALDFYNQSFLIEKSLGNLGGQADTLTCIGIVYYILGEKQKALDFYDQAAAIYKAVGNNRGQADMLTDIGMIHSDLRDHLKALQFYNDALAIYTEMGDLTDEAMVLGSIANSFFDLGEPQKAIQTYNQLLPLFRATNDRDDEAVTLMNIGTFYSTQGDVQKGMDFYNQALAIATVIGDPILEASIFESMFSSQKTRKPALSIFYGKQAVNILQQIRSNIKGMGQEVQKTFLSSKESYYQDLADLLIGQGRLPEAQQVLDLLKQQEYADYVRGEKLDPSEPLSLTPAELGAQQDYQKSTAQMVSIGEQWSELKKVAARTPEQEAKYQQLSGQLTNASQGMSGYYGRLYTVFGTDSDANKQVADVKGQTALLKQQIAKSPHTVALYTLVTKDRYSVIVITPATMVAREYPISENDLNRKVAALQQVLRNPAADPKPAAQDMYRILIAPVKADLDQARAETLVWSLDGVLRYVPMAALYDGRQYVVENYNTVTITPASVAHLADTPNVGNISAVAMGISRKYEEGLPALPAVAFELDKIVKDARVQGADGVLPGTILLNGNFTENAMESQLSGQHSVVHIASHFVFKPGDDSQSYLLLANAIEGSGFHLTVAGFRDNQNLSLDDTDLLTLSACDTGISGSASNGREIDGLATTAQLKGARAVISSLWEVNDSSTGDLMADFYRRWASGSGKVMKGAALREAQLDLLRAKVTPQPGFAGRGFGIEDNGTGVHAQPANFAHPYYWAPFVLMGNWR